MQIAVIKYNAGNIQSVSYALERLGVDFQITSEPEEIMKADKVLFPGVGEASTTMAFLKENKLDKVICGLTQPVLGVCLGMQLMCRHSEENNTPCLGIYDEAVKLFRATAEEKVPHMGWNQLTEIKGWLSPRLEGQNAYFVHSYYVPVNPFTTAVTNYIQPFCSAMQKNNFFAVQFHPEKSAGAGEMVLKSFLEI